MRRNAVSSGFFLVVVVALLAGTAAAQQDKPQRSTGINMGTLLANDAVQKELGLEGAVLEKAKTLSMDYRVEYLNVVPREPDLHSLPVAEAHAKMLDFFATFWTSRAMVAATMRPKIKAALSPQQYERLQQIEWQAAGLTVLRDPEFAQLLGITNEQSAKREAIEKEYNQKELAVYVAGNDEERREKLPSIRADARAQLRDVLTADQYEKWTQLKGKEFDVASLRNTRRNRR